MCKELMTTYQLLIDTENVGLKWVNRITQRDVNNDVTTHLFYSDNTASLTLDMLWGLSCSKEFILHKCPGHLGKDGLDNLIMTYTGYLINKLSDNKNTEIPSSHRIIIVSADSGYDSLIRNITSMYDLYFGYSNQYKFLPDNTDIQRAVINPEMEGNILSLIKIVSPVEIESLRASTSQYGMTKLSTATDVTKDIPSEKSSDNKKLEDMYNMAEAIVKPFMYEIMESYNVSCPNLPRKLVMLMWANRNEPRVLTEVHNFLTRQFDFIEIGVTMYRTLKPYLLQILDIYKSDK